MMGVWNRIRRVWFKADIGETRLGGRLQSGQDWRAEGSAAGLRLGARVGSTLVWKLPAESTREALRTRLRCCEFGRETKSRFPRSIRERRCRRTSTNMLDNWINGSVRTRMRGESRIELDSLDWLAMELNVSV